MTNRRKSKARRTARGGSRQRVAGAVEPGVDFALAQLFRSECSDCGCRVLRWFTGAEAAGVLGFVAAVELLNTLPRQQAPHAACWRCTRCGSSGAFGPAEWVGF